MADESANWARSVAAVYRADRGRVLASLIRLLGDFDLAEEAVHDAFAAAIEQWPVRGLPESPWRWLVSAGRFRTIDRLRRQKRFAAAKAELTHALELDALPEEDAMAGAESIADDSLRLIFTCCHPALPPDAQVALTLREVCGLTTEDIARAFLTRAPTVAQRIVRAKARIHDAGLPYAVPGLEELPARLESVLRVVYLVFNEGYSADASGPRRELADEAIRLGRLLVGLLPDAEALGVLALMLLHEARRPARTGGDGEVVLLPDQDRGLWDRPRIGEGLALLGRAYASGEIGPYWLEAAIAAEHCKAGTAAATDWRRIVELYDLLLTADRSPVVELNRAAAVAMRDGPDRGVGLMDALLARGDLADYHPAYAARAELLRRLGRLDDAARDYRRALELVREAPERRFLEGRLAALSGDQGATSSAVISSTSDS
jgi:RNA polymerase sigma-70 factor (ECF subfamily)